MTRILARLTVAFAVGLLLSVLGLQVRAGQQPKVGDTAPNFTLNALDGSKVYLKPLVKQGKVVLVVLRGYPGYQCPFCTAQVGSLIQSGDTFAAAKAQVVLVYPGPADGLKGHADEFVRGKDIPQNFHLLLDPNYSMVNLYGLRWNAPNETAYPSTFILDAKGKITFAKIGKSHDDRAKTADILKALGS